MATDVSDPAWLRKAIAEREASTTANKTAIKRLKRLLERAEGKS